jgi:hypothetical protein
MTKCWQRVKCFFASRWKSLRQQRSKPFRTPVDATSAFSTAKLAYDAVIVHTCRRRSPGRRDRPTFHLPFLVSIKQLKTCVPRICKLACARPCPSPSSKSLPASCVCQKRARARVASIGPRAPNNLDWWTRIKAFSSRTTFPAVRTLSPTTNQPSSTMDKRT